MSLFEQGDRSHAPIDEQRAYLRTLQAEQARVLEASGLSTKAWARRGDVSQELKDATSLSVAVTSGEDPGGNAIERPSIKFTTTADPKYPGQTVSAYVVVAESHEVIGALLPAPGFSEEDARVVVDLLGPIKVGQSQGLLGEMGADLADIVDPREHSIFL